ERDRGLDLDGRVLELHVVAVGRHGGPGGADDRGVDRRRRRADHADDRALLDLDRGRLIAPDQHAAHGPVPNEGRLGCRPRDIGLTKIAVAQVVLGAAGGAARLTVAVAGIGRAAEELLHRIEDRVVADAHPAVETIGGVRAADLTVAARALAAAVRAQLVGRAHAGRAVVVDAAHLAVGLRLLAEQPAGRGRHREPGDD